MKTLNKILQLTLLSAVAFTAKGYVFVENITIDELQYTQNTNQTDSINKKIKTISKSTIKKENFVKEELGNTIKLFNLVNLITDKIYSDPNFLKIGEGQLKNDRIKKSEIWNEKKISELVMKAIFEELHPVIISGDYKNKYNQLKINFKNIKGQTISEEDQRNTKKLIRNAFKNFNAMYDFQQKTLKALEEGKEQNNEKIYLLGANNEKYSIKYSGEERIRFHDIQHTPSFIDNSKNISEIINFGRGRTYGFYNFHNEAVYDHNDEIQSNKNIKGKTVLLGKGQSPATAIIRNINLLLSEIKNNPNWSDKGYNTKAIQTNLILNKFISTMWNAAKQYNKRASLQKFTINDEKNSKNFQNIFKVAMVNGDEKLLDNPSNKYTDYEQLKQAQKENKLDFIGDWTYHGQIELSDKLNKIINNEIRETYKYYKKNKKKFSGWGSISPRIKNNLTETLKKEIEKTEYKKEDRIHKHYIRSLLDNETSMRELSIGIAEKILEERYFYYPEGVSLKFYLLEYTDLDTNKTKTYLSTIATNKQ